MTSQINYSNIDSAFPVAGQDNDSQGFRDNFAAIKTALQYANAEITGLQNNGAVINSSNNFGGNQIYNAEFLYNSQTVFPLGVLSGTVNLDWKNGPVQSITASGNLTLTFSNWPALNKMGSILLIINLTAGQTISYPGSVNKTFFTNPSATGTYLLEFTTIDNGSTIYLTNKVGLDFYYQGNQLITGPGAIALTGLYTSINTTGADAYTLADGSEGQEKTIIMRTNGGNGTVTPTNPLGYSSIDFTAVGQTATLVFINGYWHVKSYFGVTINP